MEKKLVERVTALQAGVSSFRQLPFKSQVKKRVLARPALRKKLVELTLMETPRERFTAKSRAFAILGLIPPGHDLYETFMDVLAEQVEGFYDSDGKVLYMMADQWSSVQDIIAIHELTHVLQDQHFNIESYPIEDETKQDLSNVVHAVIEGDATLVMMKFGSSKYARRLRTDTRLVMKLFPSILEQMEGEEISIQDAAQQVFPTWKNEKLLAAPLLIRATLLFSYIQGLQFVLRAQRRGGWQAVNALFNDMPQSTEQILDPEKYFVVRDKPTSIEWQKASSLLPATFKLTYHSILGELYISLLLRQWLGPSVNPRAWQGWDGDHVLYYENGKTGKVFMVWATVWDSATDALEFEKAYRNLLGERAKWAWRGKTPGIYQGIAARAPGKPRQAHKVNNYVERRGNEVLILRGNLPAEDMRKVASRAWHGRQLHEAPPVRPKKSR